jgi:predicted alpha/beta superfamily hydrolase
MSQAAATILDAEDLGPATVPWSRAHRLTCQTIGQDFLIEVAYPLIPIQPGQKVPVVYVLDGNNSFAMTAQIARMIQYGPFPLPPTLIVGIGYAAAKPGDDTRARHLRVRDYTPWVDQSVEARYRSAPAAWALPADIKQGGAAAFSAFIETQLKPFIAAHYPADPDDATLVGMSLGGLFAMHTLLTAPETFKRYIVASPGLYWDERRIFEAEAGLAARVKDLPVHLFLSVGGLEEAMDVPGRFVSNLYELEARLRQRAYPSLDMSFHVFPDDTHMSVFPAAFSRGLTAVFGGHRNTNDWGKVLNTA